MVSIQETQWPSLHPLFGLNKDPCILVPRQEFLDFVPRCLDGLNNSQWGEVFLGCHKNGIIRFSLLVQVTQIKRQRLGVVDLFLLVPNWGEWWMSARLLQQMHQVLSEDIPAVLHEELLAHTVIAEDKAYMLRFPRQLLPVVCPPSLASHHSFQSLNTVCSFPPLCLFPDSSLCLLYFPHLLP